MATKRPTRKQKAEAAREKLVLDHLHVVAKIARQVHSKMTHVALEELEHDGYLGLVQAANTYTPEKGVFAHFAYFRVHGAMIDAHNRARYRDETHESLDGISEQLGFLPRRMVECQRPHPDELAATREERRLLARAVDSLPAEEKRVFVAFLAGVPLPQTAAEFGRSPAWARQKLAAARAQLGATVAMWGMGLDKAA